MLLAEGKFIGSGLYGILLYSLIPTILGGLFVYAAFFLRDKRKYHKLWMLLVVPVIYCISFLLVCALNLYLNTTATALGGLSDQIKTHYRTMGIIRFLPVFIWLGGIASFYFIFSNTFNRNITNAKKCLFLLLCLLPLALCAYFSHITPKIASWFVYRIAVAAYLPFWLCCVPRIFPGRTYRHFLSRFCKPRKTEDDVHLD
jgi:hypothetical protein